MHLADVTWTDADEHETNLAVLPVGSTEQHGPHAPLGTDAFTAEAIAEAGLERADSDGVLAPTIPVGVAEEHRHFSGTLWVSEATFRSYVGETIESLASHGWDRVVVVNGHGGNVDPLREVCGRLVRDELAYAVPFTWFDAVDTGDTDVSMGHGGPVETSLLLALQDTRVHTDRLDAARTDAADSWGEWVSGVNLAYDAAEFADNGVVGDPTESSDDLGRTLFEDAQSKLATLLDVVADRDVSRPAHR